MQFLPVVGGMFGGTAATAATAGEAGIAADAAAIATTNAATWGGAAATALPSITAGTSAITGAAAAAGIDTALGYGSVGLSGVSGYMQQQAANRAAEFNAKAANREADQTIEQGQIAEQRLRIQTAQALGEQRAAAAAGGIDPNTGTPLKQQETTDQFGEFDALTTRMNAQQRADTLREQAAAYKSSEVNPIISAFTSAASTGVGFLGNRATRRLYSQSYP